MTIDDKIRNEKLQNDINRRAGKIDKCEYITGKEILPSNQREIIGQAKFAYSPLGKAFEKQTEKQVGALKSLALSNKKDELKQIEGIFPQNLMSDLTCVKLKEIVKLQDIIKKDGLNYKSKRGKTYNFGKYSLSIVFLRHIHDGYFSLEDADNKQSNFATELKNFDKDIKTCEKKSFLNNLE